MEAVSLKIAPELDQLERITAAVEDFAERDHWPPDLTFKVNLVLDELSVNVVNYGGEASEIEVSLVSDSDRVRVEISDDGHPFDPLTDAPAPDLTSPIESRPIGGLGVHFTRTLMDDVEYRRESGQNRLRIVTRKVR